MFILKVLGGPLFGVEVVLPEQDCFIQTVDISTEKLGNGADLDTPDVFFTLPVAGDAPNFRLKRELDKDGAAALVAECYAPDTGSWTERVIMNKPVAFGAARIAVRESHEAWSDEVARGDVKGQGGRAPRSRHSSLGLRAACACAAALILSGGAWWAVKAWSGPTTATVEALLADLPAQVIAHGGRTYVLADDAATLAWARRILVDRGAANGVELRSRATDVENVELKLEQEGIPFFKVDIADGRHPRVLLRAGDKPPSPAMLAEAAQQVAAVLPYATTVIPLYRYAQEARRAALDLAAHVGAPIQSRDTGDRFVVEIGGGLDDTQLEVVSRDLRSLHSTWGRRYVSLVVRQVELAEMQGVRIGEGGYRLMSGRHVMFASQPSAPAAMSQVRAMLN